VLAEGRAKGRAGLDVGRYRGLYQLPAAEVTDDGA